jgi:drug/metabolite transporter (DMT)-like permease
MGIMTNERVSRALPILALLAVQLIFGFNFAASKVVLQHYPPTLWGAIRLLFSALLMFAFSKKWVPIEQRRMDSKFLKKTFIYGLFGMALSQFFFMFGIKNTTTTNAAIMNTLTPLFTLLIAMMIGTERLTVRRSIGFLLAIIGAVVIRDLSEFKLSSDTVLGDLSTVMNCLSLAIYFTLSQKFLKENSPFWATAWMFLFGALVLFVMAASDLGHLFVSGLDPRFFIAAFYSIFLATLVTYFLNAWTLTKVSPSMVALFFYFQPIVAVFNGWLSLGENPTVRTFVAMGLIFAGLGLGVVRKR